MSYGQAYLSKNKKNMRTIKYKRSYSRMRVEEEGIVTSHLPAYTDILKIRFVIVRYPVLVNALQLHVSTFPVGKSMVVVYLRCQHAVPKKSSPNWDTWQGLYVSASSGMGSKHTFAWIGYYSVCCLSEKYFAELHQNISKPKPRKGSGESRNYVLQCEFCLKFIVSAWGFVADRRTAPESLKEPDCMSQGIMRYCSVHVTCTS